MERYVGNMDPQERREKIAILPAYRDAYNEVARPHDQVVLPRYFLTAWGPVLGPSAIALYMVLRDACFGSSPGEGSRVSTMSQAELGRAVGLLDRGAVGDTLAHLERLGFITRERHCEWDPRERRVMRRPDRIRVFYEIPLTTADSVEVIVRESAEPVREGGKIPPSAHEGGKKPPSVERPQVVDFAVKGGKTLQNGSKDNGNYKPLEDRSANTEADSPRAGLVEQLVEELGDARSARFYHLVATRVPESLVRRLLSETRSAKLEGRLNGPPGAYFTAAVTRAAAEMGISLRGRRAP